MTIFPLTSDGFAEGYVQEVGFTQGDDFSDEGYQPGCVVVSGTMDASELVSLDGDGKEVPVDNLVFVDDRRLFGATMEELVHRVRQCIRGTLSKGGAVHPGKLEFFEFVV